MRRFIAWGGEVVLLAIAMVAATIVGGWWGVLAAAFVWGAWSGRAGRVALAAAWAWGSVLVWTAASGPLAAVIAALGTIAGAPGWALVVATLVFPAVMAWSAAVVGGVVRGERTANDREETNRKGKGETATA
jgi:hypothetical protein